MESFIQPACPDAWLLAQTEIVDIVRAVMIWAARDFVLLHELAHVVFCHYGEKAKTEELQADNLALNCVVQINREFAPPDDLFAAIACSGMALVLYFLSIVDALADKIVSDTHPPALVRRAALSLALKRTISPKDLPNHVALDELMVILFEAAIAGTNAAIDDSVMLAGIQGIKQVELVIIPPDKKAAALVLLRDRATR